MNIKQSKYFLSAIVVLAFMVRITGIGWDSGFHFHPDERMLIMVAGRIQFFNQLNPDFFNYGSLPIYLLSGISQLIDMVFGTQFATYDGMLWVGRTVSTVLDILVLILIYRTVLLLFNNKSIALWSSFFYAIAFFPIQNSHFFIVDTFLNFFSTLLMYVLLRYYQEPTYKKIGVVSLVFAAAITTKVSAIIFLPIIGLVILIAHKHNISIFQRVLRGIKNMLNTQYHIQNTRSYVQQIITRSLIFGICFLVFGFVFMPYAFLDYARFISDVSAQIRMNSDPYIFPYTLQYVGTVPYIYYLKNIFFWGLGPAISILAIIGAYRLLRILMKHTTLFIHHNAMILIWILFYIIYFVVIGKSAVKFMRYMLLMYPFFAILAGVGVTVILNWFQDLSPHNWFSIRRRFRNKFGMTEITLIALPLIWTTAFLNIYTTPNTRIQATAWINQFIPEGSTLAVEHWDDRVPIFDPGKYNYEELTLYDIPDDGRKWEVLHEKLNRSDFIIIASNRLYTPLQQLNTCNNDTYPRCYPITADYYKKLFNHELNFVKIAQFTSYPRICLLRDMCYVLHDDASDESFTVYDHPKIMIFAKTNQ